MYNQYISSILTICRR